MSTSTKENRPMRTEVHKSILTGGQAVVHRHLDTQQEFDAFQEELAKTFGGKVLDADNFSLAIEQVFEKVTGFKITGWVELEMAMMCVIWGWVDCIKDPDWGFDERTYCLGKALRKKFGIKLEKGSGQ